MSERIRFVTLQREGLYSMTELCARFGIARKTGYKWLARFAAQGVEGLAERSRAPHHCPHQTTAEAAAALVQLRTTHPHWGPKKLLSYLARHQPHLALPAVSTAGDLLQREGLVAARPGRRRPAPPTTPPVAPTAANEVWSADFKGEFRTGDRQLCYPLTIADTHSRYLLACEALTSTRQEGVFPVFLRLFQEYGLPAAIRTDNGVPFATTALARLSQLAIWWIALGITPQRITPGKPQQNGRHERMHRTLKADTALPPAADLAAQQARFHAFQQTYNTERPHEALQQEPPSRHYTPSPRSLPSTIAPPEYPGHFRVHRINQAGCFYFRKEAIFLSEVLTDAWIGLEEVLDGVWSVYYYQVLLARFDARRGRLST